MIKKVNKTQAITTLIAILDIIYDDNANSVREIRNKLINLADGSSLSQFDIDKIFGNWADYNPKPNDPHKAIKFICAYIKEQMFK